MRKHGAGSGGVCLLIVAFLSACGSSGGSGGSPDGDLLAAVAGAYVVDLDRSIAAIPANGITASAAAERNERLRAAFGADSYSLAIQTDGTFQLLIRRDQTVHTLKGACSASEDTVELTVTAVDGDALTEDQYARDALARDGDDLVLSDGGRSIILTRR